MSSHHSILKQYWGYDQFRPLQEDIILSVLAGRDTLALLPTGGGKSICFQVPAMMKAGICLVVSPLVALMKDQVENLRRKGITAFAIYAGISRKDLVHTLKLASTSNCRFLYVSPERLESKLFLEYLPSFDISLVAVDEAHCISQWGYDFRPPYLRIAALREYLATTPVLALTASATPVVQQDICDKLQFKNQQVFRQSFERPNLSYSIFRVDSKIIKIVEILSKVPGSSIVYCRSRKRTREIADLLKSYKITADHYHAGLTADERNVKQEDWIKNRIRTIVCTNAFGMGIDKPDVRTVIHADAPECLENYYQEAGRAGRDGKKAYAVLLYQDKDLQDLHQQVILRFPTLQEIRLVYQAIVNYLQIPNGMGEGVYYEFDLADFLQKFKIASHLVVNALKVLQQENRIVFNEQVFLSSKIQFTCNKEMLYSFEQSHPALEPVIKTLLRSYEGIFDQEVFIQERSIAYLLKMDLQAVLQSLRQLEAYRIISYQPRKEKPQLYFITSRMKAEDLTIDILGYNEKKKLYRLRVESFIEYIQQTACRSRFTGNYFGDDRMKRCGICDNCLRQKETVIPEEEFSLIEKQILSLLKLQPVHSGELISQLNGFQKEKAWKVVDFLQSEQKIEVNPLGLIRLKN